MKNPALAVTGLLLAVSCLNVSASSGTLLYDFQSGETNVYAVDFWVQGESGLETNSGDIILSVTKADTNAATLTCRGNLKTGTRRPPGSGFMMMPTMYQTRGAFPNNAEIRLDRQGNELSNGGDYPLAAPLGKLVQSLFEPLPILGSSAKVSDTAVILDEPYWLGPAEVFPNNMMGGQLYGAHIMNYPQPVLAYLAVDRQSVLQTEDEGPDLVKIHKTLKLQSLLLTGLHPRFTASSKSELVFDRRLGRLTTISTLAEAVAETETSLHHVKITFQARLLTGAELTAFLAPPAPPAPPRTLSPAELDKLAEDLRSPDIETHRSAMRNLGGENIDSPSDELIGLVAERAVDSDSFVRSSAVNFLEKHATTNQVPVLVRLLPVADWSARPPIARTLGRLKDPRSIVPLTEVIARGDQFVNNQQDISNALISIGTPAESAVLDLLQDRYIGSRHQAADILKEIGTARSLPALEKLATDPDQTLSQAAQNAIQGIKLRQ